MKWTFAGVVFKCRSSVHEKFSLDSMPQTAVVWFLFPLSWLAFFYRMQCFVVLFLKQKLSVMFKKKMKQTSVLLKQVQFL